MILGKGGWLVAQEYVQLGAVNLLDAGARQYSALVLIFIRLMHTLLFNFSARQEFPRGVNVYMDVFTSTTGTCTFLQVST